MTREEQKIDQKKQYEYRFNPFDATTWKLTSKCDFGRSYIVDLLELFEGSKQDREIATKRIERNLESFPEFWKGKKKLKKVYDLKKCYGI